MSNLWGREPAAIIGLVEAIIALGIGFGLELSGEQMALIMAALAAVLAVVTRQSVYSPSTVRSFEDPPGEITDRVGTL